MAQTCENCGCRVYALGCVNCDEDRYIEDQSYETERYIAEEAAAAIAQAVRQWEDEQIAAANHGPTKGDE